MNSSNFNLSTLLVNYPISIFAKSKVSVTFHDDGSGNKFVQKKWSGQIKDYAYFSLKNEANVYKSLNKTILRVEYDIPEKFKNIRFPKFIEAEDIGNEFILKIEYVDGQIVENLSEKQRVDAYFLVSDFIDYLNQKMNKEEKNKISSRSGLSYLFLYPLLLSRALLANSDSFVDLIKGAFILVKSLNLFLGDKNLTLTHRDLHFENIMTSGSDIIILDLELSSFTYKAFEFVTTLKYTWNRKNLHKYFWKELEGRYGKNKEVMNFIKPLIVFTATHALAANNYPKMRMKDFKNFLKFGLEI